MPELEPGLNLPGRRPDPAFREPPGVVPAETVKCGKFVKPQGPKTKVMTHDSK
jgi:hypothetical protein